MLSSPRRNDSGERDGDLIPVKTDKTDFIRWEIGINNKLKYTLNK